MHHAVTVKERKEVNGMENEGCEGVSSEKTETYSSMWRMCNACMIGTVIIKMRFVLTLC